VTPHFCGSHTRKIAGDYTVPNRFPPWPAHFLGGTHFPRFFHQESNQTRTVMIGPCWTNQYCPFRKNRGNHFLYLLVVEWGNPLLINEFTVLIGKVRASALKWLCWVMPTEKVPFRAHANDEGNFQRREVAVRSLWGWYKLPRNNMKQSFLGGR